MNNNEFENTGISTPPNRPKHKSGEKIRHLEPLFTEQKTIDQFRLYDQLIYDWLGGIEYPIKNKDGDVVYPSIPRVFATPERALAKMREVLNKDRSQRHNRVDSGGNVPLPFISIWRQINEYDPSRYSRAVQRSFKFSEDCLEVKQAPWPSPQNMPYQIEFWARNRTVLNYILQWLTLQFDNNVLHLSLSLREFDIDLYPEPLSIRIDKSSFSDNSDLESGENQRILRHTLSIIVKGYLFRPSRTVKTIQKVEFEAIEKNTGVNLDKFTVNSSDVPDKECVDVNPPLAKPE